MVASRDLSISPEEVWSRFALRGCLDLVDRGSRFHHLGAPGQQLGKPYLETAPEGKLIGGRSFEQRNHHRRQEWQALKREHHGEDVDLDRKGVVEGKRGGGGGWRG